MNNGSLSRAALAKAALKCGMSRGASTRKRRTNATLSLPDDLLSLILLLCRDGDSEYLQCPRISRTEGPLRLSWVSQRWRELSLSLGELWIGISLGFNRLVPSETDLNLLNLFISRSGDFVPLQFDLRYGHDLPRSEVGGPAAQNHVLGMQRVFQIIRHTRKRWEAISLYALNLSALDDFFECFNLRAPKLKFFQVATQATTFRGQRRPLNFLLCPELQFVKIDCPRVCIESDFSPGLTLDSMTSLDLAYSHSQLDGLTWLKCCPHLVNLSLWFYSANSDLDILADTPPITLSCLSKLSVNTYFVDGSGDPSMFLSLLTLPALRELSLSMSNLVFVSREEGWRAMTELLQRSDVTDLRSLEVQGTPIRSPELIQILHMQHGLENLSIDGTLSTKALFRALGGQDTQEFPLCPQLKKLRIRAYHGSADALADMVDARCYYDRHDLNLTSFRTLKTLMLMWCAGQSIMEHPKIKAALQYGLEIVQTPSCHPFQRSFTAA